MGILVSELPKERIRFFAGADQLGMVLLNRAANRLSYDIPMVLQHMATAKAKIPFLRMKMTPWILA